MSTTEIWQSRAEAIQPNGNVFIDGESVPAASGKTISDFSPTLNREIAQIASGDIEDINRAVKSAKKAFDSGVWSEMNPRDKKAIMLRWAELLNEHRDELALLETLDVGKPISDSLAVDTRNSARVIQWYAETIAFNSEYLLFSFLAKVGLACTEASES